MLPVVHLKDFPLLEAVWRLFSLLFETKSHTSSVLFSVIIDDAIDAIDA